MKVRINFSSIRFKLIVGGILIVIMPLALCGYVAITQSAKTVTELSKTSEKYIAQGVAMQVSATLDGELKFVSAFTLRSQVRNTAKTVNDKGIQENSGVIGAIRQDLKKRFELLQKNYAGIFLADASGIIYAESVEDGENINNWEIPQQPLFQEAKISRKTVSGEIIRSKATNEPIMPIFGPIFSDTGIFIGVFGALLKASVITDLVTAHKIGNTGYCFLINSSGIMIAHPEAKYILQLDLKTIAGMESIVKAMLAGEEGSESYVFHGIDKVAGYVPIKKKGWCVAATQNSSEFLASVISLRNNIVVIVLFSIVIITIIVFLATASITRPLNKVIEGLEDIANGKGQVALTKRIAITSIDEIGTLSLKFNSLMESISNLAVFKKVIEEENSLDEVYQRIGELFTQQLGIACCSIYQVMDAKSEMSLIYQSSFDPKEMSCHQSVFNDCELCKAKRTGHIITSITFPSICRQFSEQNGHSHYCLPILVGGAVVAVVQFIFDNADKSFDIREIEDKIFKAEQYINESLAVIETKRLMSSLRDAALVDSLTGLYNRRYLQEYTEKIVAGVLRRGKTIGLIMCDLDYFKQVNDTYGHNAGDMVLKATSQVIAQSVRESDIVIRFGGEEFLAVLLDISQDESMKIAEKIRLNIEQLKVKLPEGVIQKTISLGVSEFPSDTGTLWSCIKFADVALYRAKTEGRNRCVRFTKEMWQEDQV